MRYLLPVLILLVSRAAFGCEPDRVQSMRAGSDEQLAALTACLASTDPAMRDEFAYTTLAELLREQRPATERLEFLWSRLDELLQDDDPLGVAHPFAILVFSELARTDRIDAWMSSEQRQDLVDKASDYLENISDYRGFDAQVGWRHGVAHAADLAMQLALNPALSEAQQLQLLGAIAEQVAPNHAYRFGESERLARPVLFIAMREELEPQDWQDWFAGVTDPAPLTGWGDVWTDADGLARRHNLRAFAQEIYLNATLSEQPGIQGLEPLALEIIKVLQ